MVPWAFGSAGAPTASNAARSDASADCMACGVNARGSIVQLATTSLPTTASRWNLTKTGHRVWTRVFPVVLLTRLTSSSLATPFGLNAVRYSSAPTWKRARMNLMAFPAAFLPS